MHKSRDEVLPFIVRSAEQWDGPDGPWSSFEISAGTPSQPFRAYPVTLSPHVTVPVREGCVGPLSQVQDCGRLRGMDNNLSAGFDRNLSTTWLFSGIYPAFPEQALFATPGLYGRDVVQIERHGSSAIATIPQQTIVGVAQSSFWLGTLGLSVASFNVTSLPTTSLLSILKSQNVIPSLSFAYNAGRHYAQDFGSLILGGFDRKKLSDNVITLPINGSRLELDVQSIVTQSNNLTRGFLPAPITMIIDTSVSHLWLPGSVCDAMLYTFGLSEDKRTGYFLLNDTSQQSFSFQKPSLIFTIGGHRAGGTTNIVLNHGSLGLSVGTPVYNATVPYFPIRRALNSSQLVLGRVFLQESYLIVDWERSNYSIGPVLDSKSNPLLEAITSTMLNTTSRVGNANVDQGKGSVIASILVPILASSILVGLFLLCRRRCRSRIGHMSSRAAADGESDALKSVQATICELPGSSRFELVASPVHSEILSMPIFELSATHPQLKKSWSHFIDADSCHELA